MDDNTDTSLSFLEPLNTPKIINNNKHQPIKILPNIIDPDLLHSKIFIPKKIEKYYKKVEKINAIYTIINDNYIKIEGKVKNTKIYVDFYDKFEFNDNLNNEIIFIIGKKKYLSTEKNKRKKEFKNSINSGLKFIDKKNIIKLKEKYIKYQIIHKNNFIFIDSPEELHKAIRNFAIIIEKDRKFIPRVKTQIEKINLFSQTIYQIPGISESVLKSLIKKYSDFKSLRNDLINNIEKIKNIEVYSENNENKRKLGNKIAEKLLKALTSEDANEKI